jgi:hypothetical protein
MGGLQVFLFARRYKGTHFCGLNKQNPRKKKKNALIRKKRHII